MRLLRESDEGRTVQNTSIRDGQKDEELIQSLSRNDQEAGGSQERAPWKPVGGLHYHESYNHRVRQGILSPFQR